MADPRRFAAGTTMARLTEAQKITIGTKFDQPLFGQKGLDGKPAGFDVEIAKIIAAELGIPADKIEFVETTSAVREEYIEQGKVDMVVATYTINDKRKQRIAFAGPYYVAGQDILVRKDDTSITGPDSFKDGDKKVCSVTGSTPAKNIEEYLDGQAGPSSCSSTATRKCVDALQDQAGRRGHHRQRHPARLRRTKTRTRSSSLGKPFTKEPYGIGVKKDDTAFRTFINDVLEEDLHRRPLREGVEGHRGRRGSAGRRTPGQPLLGPDSVAAPAPHLAVRRGDRRTGAMDGLGRRTMRSGWS